MNEKEKEQLLEKIIKLRLNQKREKNETIDAKAIINITLICIFIKSIMDMLD